MNRRWFLKGMGILAMAPLWVRLSPKSSPKSPWRPGPKDVMTTVYAGEFVVNRQAWVALKSKRDSYIGRWAS